MNPVNGFQFLSEAYLRTRPDFTGRYTIPCLWDRVSGGLVSNNFPDLTIDFETQFGDQAKMGEVSQNEGLPHAHGEEADFSLTDVTANALKPKYHLPPLILPDLVY